MKDAVRNMVERMTGGNATVAAICASTVADVEEGDVCRRFCLCGRQHRMPQDPCRNQQHNGRAEHEKSDSCLHENHSVKSRMKFGFCLTLEAKSGIIKGNVIL